MFLHHTMKLRKCKVHALYLGRGLSVELREWETPLQIIDNPDPKVISIVIGKLSELETKMYDDIVHTRLGVGKTPELKAGTSGYGSTSKHGQKPMMDEYHNEPPLDLSVEDKFIPTKQPSQVIPLDLSFDQGSDEPSMENKAASNIEPSSVFPLDLSHDQSSDDFLLSKHDFSYGLPATSDTQLHHSPLPKFLDQTNLQVREKHSDPKLACTVSVDIIKLDLKANQTVNVMASNQKENKNGANDQDSASTISYDMGEKQEGDIPTSRISHIPEWYIKPIYKLPSSVKSLKKK